MAEEDRHCLNLYAAMVGETAKGRKGVSEGQVRARFRGIDEEWSSERRWSGGLASGEGLIFHLQEAKRGQADSDLAGRLLVVEGEFASVLKLMCREGNTLSPVVRQGWDQGELRSMTKNSAASVSEPHVSIIGHVTKTELRRHLNETESANGFANRILWVCSRRSKCLPDGGRLCDVDLRDLDRELAAAVDFARSTGELERDDRARELWHAVYPDLSEGGAGLLGAVTSRAEAQTMRIACIYALMDQSLVVRREHLEAGLEIWGYCLASAAYVFGDDLGDPVADQVRRALLESDEEGLSRTEIGRLFGGHKVKHDLDRALSALAELGQAYCQIKRGNGRPEHRWYSEEPEAREARKAGEVSNGSAR